MRVINRLLPCVLTLAALFSQPILAEEQFITLASTT